MKRKIVDCEVVRCPQCNGIGKVSWPNASCNCGSGEGCDLHDEIAIGLWGMKCRICRGTGKVKMDTKSD